MNPHPASVKMETRLQFSSNYCQIQSNTPLFTTAFSFKKAIILEKSALLWAHMHSRKPEHISAFEQSAANGQLTASRYKTEQKLGKELLILTLYPFWGTSNWYSPVLGSSGLSCPVRDHFQMPFVHSMFSTDPPPVKAEDGAEIQVPPCPAPWWLLLCGTLHACTKLPAIISKAAASCLPSVYPCIMAAWVTAAKHLFGMQEMEGSSLSSKIYLQYGAGHCQGRAAWPSGLFGPCRDSANKKHPVKGNRGFCWELLTSSIIFFRQFMSFSKKSVQEWTVQRIKGGSGKLANKWIEIYAAGS